MAKTSTVAKKPAASPAANKTTIAAAAAVSPVKPAGKKNDASSKKKQPVKGNEDSKKDAEEEAPAVMKTNTKKRPAETDAAVPDADSPTKKAKSMEEDDAKVVHVGNLPWTATDAEITAAFSTFGAVTLVRQMVGKKGKTAGKKTGIAYVHFATRKAAAAAAAAGAMKIGERETRVSASRPKGEKATSGLFVANLPYAATAEAVTEFFGGEHGEVTHCHVPKEEDGTAKGHAFVTFKSVDAAKAAFEAKKGAEFEGRKIRLDYCKPFVRSARGSGKGH